MTNKMLGTIILAVIIIGAALAGYFYWQNTKPLVVSQPSSNSNQADQSLSQAQQSQLTPPASPPASPAASSTTPNTPGCVRDFNPAKLAANTNISIANREVAVNVKNFGTITLGFYNTDAPKTVENFLRLTDAGYYDCLTFHRVAQGFVIQGGDPNGNGSGGQSAYGAPFADELNPNTASYKAGYLKGVLAMANSGPNTNGSQFFIMLADNQLPHSYTIFGHVIAGQSVVDAIGQVPITPVMGPTDGSPVTPVVMESVKIIK